MQTKQTRFVNLLRAREHYSVAMLCSTVQATCWLRFIRWNQWP